MSLPTLKQALGNEISTTLASPINASDTTISVASGSGMNASGGYAIIDEGTASEEVVYIQSVSGATLTVASGGRGLEGTSAVSHSAGAVLTDIIVASHISSLISAINAIGQTFYPIGSLYTNASDVTNPATLLGFGTWIAFGTGQVLVGIDAGQTEFNTIGKTGGEKAHTLLKAELPSYNLTVTDTGHIHTQGGQTAASNVGGGVAYGNGVSGAGTWSTNSATTGITVATGGSGTAFNNLQPYITVYIWQRTA